MVDGTALGYRCDACVRNDFEVARWPTARTRSRKSWQTYVEDDRTTMYNA